jgi:hypothetical protein
MGENGEIGKLGNRKIEKGKGGIPGNAALESKAG